MPRILVVEDEEAIARGLKFNFEQEGYAVVATGDGKAAIAEFVSAEPRFDLVVLDLMLPGMSGYDVCRTLRDADARVPILILSARTLSEDKIQAFDVGTDQYVTKPFSLAEILARVRNLLVRRPAAAAPSAPSATFAFADVTIDFERFRVEVARPDAAAHDLTTLEAQLLRYFIENRERVLSRQDILENVWPPDSDVTTRTIDNFVLRLRRMIEADPAAPRHFLSVRGTGYRFVPG